MNHLTSLRVFVSAIASPAKTERTAPFHGMVYPDGHPWSVDDVKALLGAEAFAKAPLFNVEYFKDDHFGELAKTSVTPMIDFDLGEERGTGSADSSVGIPQDRFSVRWKGLILAPTAGRNVLLTNGDGVVNITVAGKTVIDKKDAARSQTSGEVDLDAGKPTDIQVDYVHSAGGASLHLTWAAPGSAKEVLLPVASAEH